jgi:hypothetical protein
MIERSHAALLAMVLNQQDDPAEFDCGAFELALFERMKRGLPPTADMAKAIWTIPAARAAYLGLRRARSRALRRAWNDNGYSAVAQYRAASSQAMRHSVTTSGWSIQIVRSPGSGQTLVSLELEPQAMALLPANTVVRIVDSGGLVWLEGEIDSFGGIDAQWPHAGTDPDERLRSHALTISFD